MNRSNLLRYALSDLRHRPITTLMNVCAVALSAAYILVLGFYGASFHRYQENLLEESLPTKIVASVPAVTDRHLRFTEERLGAIAEIPGVERLFPCIELNVEAWLTPERAIDLLAEGTLPDDPTLSPARLAWGRDVTSDAAQEVVLSRAVFEKLGGSLGAAPTPRELVVGVGRTVGGQEETQKLALTIVGLLDSQPDERIHVPLALLRRLDLWCTNRIESLSESPSGEAPESRRVRYGWCYAYAEQGQIGRVASEATHLEVHAEREESFQVLRTDGALWAEVRRAGGAAPTREELARAATVLGATDLGHGELWESIVGTFGGVTIAALADRDPRWSECFGTGPAEPRPICVTDPRAGRALDPALYHALGGVREVGGEVPVEAGIVCDREGYARVFFDPRRSDGVETFSWVETGDPAAAAALARERGAAPPAGEERGWVFLRLPPGKPLDPWEGRAAGHGLQVGPWSELSIQASRSRRGASETWEVLVLPHAYLKLRLGAADGLGKPRPGFVHVTPSPNGPPTGPPTGSAAVAAPSPSPQSLWIGGRRLGRLAGIELPVPREALWTSVPPTGSPSGTEDAAGARGVVAWGSWDALLAFTAEAEGAGATPLRARSALAESVSALFAGDRAQVRARLGEAVADASRIVEFPGVRARLRLDSAESPPRPAVLASERELGPLAAGTLRLRWAGEPAPGPAVVTGSAWESPPHRVEGSSELPPRLAVVPEVTYREAAWRAASSPKAPLAGRPRHEAYFPDPARYLTAVRELAGLGIELRPVTPVRERTLVRYRIEDPGSADGQVGDDLVAVLRMSQPTFVDARPALSLEAAAGPREERVELVGTDPRDPERFAHLPQCGTWLVGTKGANQVLLPSALLEDGPEDLGPGDLGREHLGRVLSVSFRRALFAGSEERLLLPLEVVGVVQGERAFVSRQLLVGVALWQRGKLVYNEIRGAFESPIELAQRAGDLRCSVFARTQGDVAPLVAALQARGYHTEDRLADQKSLRRLGRVLGLVVGFFVLGCVVNAAITVFVATLMNVKSKIFEIGILRAHGLRRRAVIGIFASQGVLVGTLAFLTSVVGVWLLEPGLRTVVRQVFALEGEGLLAGSPFELELWWLSVTAFGVALAFSFGGVVLPAAFASRLSPVEALRRRE